MRDIKDILKAWANVQISKRVGTEYPYKSSVFLCKEGNNYRPTLDEDECRYVDNAMASIFKVNEKWHALLKSYYLEGKPYERLTIISCMSYKRTRLEIEKAETYIFAKLDDKIQDLAA